MSEKCLDSRGRWRCKTVSFRMSHAENNQLTNLAKLSGLTKQDYIISRLLDREVVVQGNPKVYKALRNALGTVIFELRRIENGEKIDEDLLTLIDQIANILNEMKGECE